MNANPAQADQTLRNLFLRQLNSLKLNRENIPLNVLKTKYKKGYETLCQELKVTGSQYAKQLTLSGIRFHKDYITEGTDRINKVIEQSGLMKQLSKAVFTDQSIDNFESLCGELRIQVQQEAETFYREHLGLLITEECLVTPGVLPLVFSLVNGCVLVEDKWIPKENLITQRKEINNA